MHGVNVLVARSGGAEGGGACASPRRRHERARAHLAGRAGRRAAYRHRPRAARRRARGGGLPAPDEPPVKHTEGTSPDRSADQLEVLREQREAAQRALEDERRRYQGLFEFAPCGYVVTDAFGIIQEMNRTAELLFNHRRESLRRKPLVVLFPREARPSFLSHLHRLLRRGAREVETWETPLVRAGAAPFPAEVAASAVLDGEGRPAGLCWLVRDVSDRKEVERALEAERELVAVILRGTADGLVATDRTGSVVL